MLVILSGCAKKGTPSGGPVDDISPQIVSVYPDSFATFVPVDTTLHVVFSERIDPESLDRALWISPRALVVKSIKRDDLTLAIKFRDPLPESGSVSVLVGTGLVDRRGNRLTDPYRWSFTAGAAVDSGSITGTVAHSEGRFSGKKRARIVVAVYDVADTVSDLSRAEPLALTEATQLGRFVLQGLSTDSASLRVVPFLDTNGNYVSDTREEFVSARFATVAMSPEHPTHELAIRLVDPGSPGVLSGVVTRASGDSTTMGIQLYAAEDDSLSSAAASGRLTPPGSFEVSRVPAGAYRLVVFCDENENNFRDIKELWMVWGDTLRVLPGDTTRVDTIRVLDCTIER